MILVTGCAGYIGSHCVLDLIKNGYDVVGFDSLETGTIQAVEALKNFEAPAKFVDFIKGDLKNPSEIESVFEKHKIDAVVHFAAFSIVPESVQKPFEYYKNNVGGTINLLGAMLKNNVKKIVFSSTCATYGEPQYVPIDEKHPQNPLTPYGNSKYFIERILHDFEKAYGFKSVIFRYFNVAGASIECVIGENHNPETHLIPNVLKSAISSGKEFSLYGNDYPTKDGTAVRDYINVCDLCVAHRLGLEYLQRENKSQIFNLGTENGHSVKEVFDACEKIANKEIPLKICPRRDGDPSSLIANASKVKEILNWQALTPLENSVKTAYEWEKKQ